jgi:MFS transporter, ACS family, hexuronate transporter
VSPWGEGIWIGSDSRSVRATGWRALRWRVVGLVMLATLVNYLDRACLGVVAPTLKGELGIDEEQLSYVITAFQLAYMATMPLAGRLGDWLGTRATFLLAVVWWSVANVLHGFATGWRSLAFYRALLGIGEAGNFPTAGKVVAEWFPAEERTLATGVFNLGAGFGAMLAPPLVTALLLAFGWQAAFVVTGALGFVWAGLWRRLYHPPESHPRITAAELELIERGRIRDAASTRAAGVWRLLLPERNFWGLAGARFLAEPAWQFFVYWIPLYLATERGLNIKEIAWFAWMPFLAADLGGLFGGFLSPFLQRRGLTLLTARKAAATVSACLMVGAVFIGQAATPGRAIAFFCVGAFAHQSLSSTLLTLPADLFPTRTVASAGGLAGGIGYLGGLLFTLVIGHVAVRVGYGPLFVAIAFLDLAGAALLWSLLRPPRAAASAA